MVDFNLYGIKGIKYSKDEQRVKCPNCPPYKNKGSESSKDLTVNADKGTWFCHRCGFTSKGVNRVIKSNAKPLVESIYTWFERRKISKEIVDRNKIKYEKRYISGANKDCICFNYYFKNDLVNIKYRSKDKDFAQEKNPTRVPYKIDDIEKTNECIITEGEIDALSFEVIGYKNAVSVPDGAISPNTKNIKTKLDFLKLTVDYFKDKEKIYLAVDDDPSGIKLREELSRRLGKKRCYIVRYSKGCKDANEVLMKFGSQELKNCLDRSEPYPIEGITFAKSRQDEYNDIYLHGYPNGADTGFREFDKLIKWFDSKLCVVSGVPSHGKSNFTDQLAIKLAVRHDWKFGIFSPESGKIEIHLHRLAEILIGKPFTPNYNGQMNIQDRDDAFKFINEHFFFIQPENGKDNLDGILELAEVLVLREGIKGLILDPWNTINHNYGNDSETDYTGKALTKMLYFTRSHGLATTIVAHPTKLFKQKGKSIYEEPTLYNISGSAHWANKTDIGIIVYRQFDEKTGGTEFTKVIVQKVKHKFMGKHGYVKFQFDLSCQRYNEEKSTKNIDNELREPEIKPSDFKENDPF